MISWRGDVPRVHVVTDDQVLAREGWLSQATSVLEAGGSSVALHVRGPGTAGAEIFRLVAELLTASASFGSWLVVNDRVDVALAAGAGAVHLGRRSLSANVVRGLLDGGVRIGVSCRTMGEVAEAEADGADYAFLGSVYSTPTHPGETPIGIGLFEEVAQRVCGWPLIGIGGIDAGRAETVGAVGGYGVAVLSGVWDADDPADAVWEYVEAVAACGNGETEK